MTHKIDITGKPRGTGWVKMTSLEITVLSHFVNAKEQQPGRERILRNATPDDEKYVFRVANGELRRCEDSPNQFEPDFRLVAMNMKQLHNAIARGQRNPSLIQGVVLGPASDAEAKKFVKTK